MKLKDFRKETKDFDDDTEIIICGHINYCIKYIDLIHNRVPDNTPMAIIPGVVFYKKKLEIEVYK